MTYQQLDDRLRHGILANTETHRLQSFGRADKYKNKSCNVSKPEVLASNQNTVNMTWGHSQCTRRLESDAAMELFVTSGSCQLFVCVLIARNWFCVKRFFGERQSDAVSLTRCFSRPSTGRRCIYYSYLLAASENNVSA